MCEVDIIHCAFQLKGCNQCETHAACRESHQQQRHDCYLQAAFGYTLQDNR